MQCEVRESRWGRMSWKRLKLFPQGSKTMNTFVFHLPPSRRDPCQGPFYGGEKNPNKKSTKTCPILSHTILDKQTEKRRGKREEGEEKRRGKREERKEKRRGKREKRREEKKRGTLIFASTPIMLFKNFLGLRFNMP
jgi:hypothetical protein